MDQFPIIVGVVWLAVVSPGADFALVSRTSFIEGPRAGLAVAVGIAIACWFHVAYAIFALGLVERFAPPALDMVQIAGAAYLVYLGARMAWERSGEQATSRAARSGARSLARGLLTNALNPKTSVFVVSLYSQVVAPGTSLAVQLGYGFVISASHLVWFAAVATLLSRPAVRGRVLRHQRAVNCIIGAVLVCLGVALALADLSHANGS